MSGIMVGSTRPTFGTAVATPSGTAQAATPKTSDPMSALDANIAQLSKQFGSESPVGMTKSPSDAFAPADSTSSHLTFGTEKSGGGGGLVAAAQPQPQGEATLSNLLEKPQHSANHGLENAFLSCAGGGGVASGTIGTHGSGFLSSSG